MIEKIIVGAGNFHHHKVNQASAIQCIIWFVHLSAGRSILIISCHSYDVPIEVSPVFYKCQYVLNGMGLVGVPILSVSFVYPGLTPRLMLQRFVSHFHPCRQLYLQWNLTFHPGLRGVRHLLSLPAWPGLAPSPDRPGGRVEHSHWSRSIQILCSHWLRSCHCQATQRHFLPFTVSLWQKGWLPCT